MKIFKGVYSVIMRENPEMPFKTADHYTVVCLDYGTMKVFYVSKAGTLHELVNGQWVLNEERSYNTKAVSTTYTDCDLSYVMNNAIITIPGREYDMSWTTPYEEVI